MASKGLILYMMFKEETRARGFYIKVNSFPPCQGKSPGSRWCECYMLCETAQLDALQGIKLVQLTRWLH